MYELELLVFAASGFFTFRFLKRWYACIVNAWPPERHRPVKRALGWLPVAAACMTLCTLLLLASYDVRGDSFYMLFYILLGAAWQYFCVFLMTMLFDISWRDDILHANNRAALAAFIGGFLGANLIYNGANIGDGPGWWCVVFAGALGLGAWLALALILNKATCLFERVTVEREFGAGVRLGAYLLASGLLMGRASGGDWTSFGSTVVEFLDGWPALILTLAAILVELDVYRAGDHAQLDTGRDPEEGNSLASRSVLWAAVYIAIAVVSVVLLPPFHSNPLYP